MNLISRIPYIFSLFTALIIAIISILQEKSFRNICMRTSITLVIFYFIGFVIEKCIEKILQEENKRKLNIEEEQQKEQDKEERNSEEKSNEEKNNQEHDEDFASIEYEHVDRSAVKNNV